MYADSHSLRRATIPNKEFDGTDEQKKFREDLNKAQICDIRDLTLDPAGDSKSKPKEGDKQSERCLMCQAEGGPWGKIKREAFGHSIGYRAEYIRSR